MACLEILALILLILPFFFYKRNSKERRKILDAVEKFNGARWIPILGTTWTQLVIPRNELFHHMYERAKRFGPVYRSWVGSEPIIHINKAEHAEIVLRSSVNITKGRNYDFMRPWLGNGLVTGGGAQWQIHRKLITPAFHFKILDTFQEVFSEKAQMLADELKNLADGRFFDFYPLITHCALDIISETAMGVKINAMKDADSGYVKAIYIVADIVLHRWFRPWLHPNFLFRLSPIGREQQRNIRIVHEFAEKVIAERRERLEKHGIEEMCLDDLLLGKKKRLAFLDLLLQANMEKKLLTNQEIREEVDTFMFAGHDTTTASTSWTLFQLGNYPDIQERVQQELDSIFHGEERPVEPNDIVKMQYLDRVIKETLRFHCVVPFLIRRLTEDIYLDGKLVPAGVQVSIHMYNIHMDPEQYSEPFHFDPDRFLPEVSAKRNPYAYIPFSAGPRNCIGQKFALRNTKTLLATVLRKYKVKSLLKQHEAKYKVDVILKPQKGMQLSFEPRTLQF